MSRTSRSAKRPVPRELYKHLVSSKMKPGPDDLLPSLDKPLPKDVSAKIAKLSKQGVKRSQIAKQLGVPKIHVTQELIRLGS